MIHFSQLFPVFCFSICFLILFFSTDYLYHQLKFKAEQTRKIAHVMTGVIALSFPFFFETNIQVAILCSSFLILLFFSERFNWFQSITGVNRKSIGSWLFPVAVFFCFWSFKKEGNILLYTIPMLILTISDSLASLIGKKYKIGEYKVFGAVKSFLGSGVFFLSALIILLSAPLEGYFLSFLFIAFILTVVEAISISGLDNISIPLACVFLINNLV